MFIAIFASRKVAMVSTSAYLLEGFVGIPVFVSMKCGPSVFFGTTGGYLLGFLAVSYICSCKTSLVQYTFLNTVILQLFGLIMLYFFGVGYLSYLIGFENALKFGLYPFLLGAFCKIILVALAKSVHNRYFCDSV